MKPVWKWIIWVAVCFIILVAATGWYVSYRLKPKLGVELKEWINHGTDGRYMLTYDRLDLSILAGNATATNIRFKPAELHRISKTSDASYDIQIGHLQVAGVSLLRLLTSGNIHINTIVLDTPSIRIITHTRPDTVDSDTARNERPLRLTDRNAWVDGINVKRFVIRGGKLALVSDHDALRLHSRQIHATVEDLRLDSAALRDTARIYGASAIHVVAKTVAYTRRDSLYQLHTGPLRLETERQELVVNDVRYGPTVNKAAFYDRVQLAEDIGDINIARINLNGLDVGRWIRTQTIAASALRIDSGSISVYKDKTLPNPPENKIGKSPHQQLLKMDQRLALDSALMSNVDICFTEVSDQTGEAGTVTFEETTAEIFHITNDPFELARERFMLLHARSRAMGVGDLTVNFRFDLLDSLGAHTYSAQLDAIDAAAFNRMLTPQLRVEIEQGRIHTLRFDMAANDLRTTGTLQLDYDRLKVNMLREDGDGGTSPKKLVSFFANRFVLNDSNPDANGVHHTGQVYIERPHSFSFFKMIWRSIREGTKGCIGLEDR